jgi:predicted RNA-binding protein with PUA-like domain
MQYWLMKVEPSEWSWDQQVAQGVSAWNGVRNHQAARNLRSMEIGDLSFFYHSVTGKAIQGIVEVVKKAYPDPTDPSGKFVSVDIKTVASFKTPVSLAAIKADPTLGHLALVRQVRLSVMPVDEMSWQKVKSMGGI